MLDFDLAPIDEIEPFLDFISDPETRMPSQEAEVPEEEQLIPGTASYKMARKKLQNRESARRSRMRKQKELEHFKSKLQEITELNNQLAIQNQSLKSENETLQKDLDFYKNLVVRPKGNTKLLVTTTAFTIACIFMILQGETDSNAPLVGNRTLKSFRSEEPELGGIWFFVCFFVAIISGVFYVGGFLRGKR